MEILFATTNVAKVVALAERIGPALTISPLPKSLRGHRPPDSLEDGGSFETIALAKARYWSRHIPGIVIATSDGGLTSPSLEDRWDPIRTSRFLGAKASNRERVGAMLELSRDLSGPKRMIGWMESIAMAANGKVLAVFTAESPPGVLATVAPPFSQENGFWIPQVWLCPEFGNRRLVDLTESERLSRRDHWAILGDAVSTWARDRHQSTTADE